MHQRKKVLYLITKATWGGAQKYVFDLATLLPKNTFEVTAALGGDGVLVEKLQKSGVRTISIPHLERDISIVKEIRAFRSLLRILRDEKPDIVHLNSSKAGGLGALAARVVGIPRIIFTAHGWPFAEKRTIVWRAFAWLGSWITALLAHKIIVVSNYDRSYAERMPFIGKKVVRIYNGIDLHMTFGTGECIRAAFPTGVKITGTVGELTHNKNQGALIEEARRTPTMFVAIVGEGEERKRLESKIKEYALDERVKLFGFVPSAEAMRGFDSFALPSTKEGLPYVLLEARLAGLPIIAHRVGGVREVLDNNIEEFSLQKMIAETTALYSS